jgi:hypothetical protein
LIRNQRSSVCFGAALALCLGAACVGSGLGVPNDEPDPEAVPKTYQEIQSMIFDPMCAAQCHRGGAAPKGLSLEPLRAIKNLVGVESVEVPGLLRVAPGEPEQSYLISKILPADPRRVGSRMPRTGPPFVSTRQINAIKRWIAAGATETWIDRDIDAGARADAAVTTTDAAADDASAAADASLAWESR